jgi:hypothetical protein
MACFILVAALAPWQSLLCNTVALGGSAQQPEAPGARDRDQARALVAAMLVNDLRVLTLEWTQGTEHQDPATGEWQPMAEHQFGSTEGGAWYVQTTQHLQRADGSDAGILRIRLATPDGIIQRGLLLDANNGSIEPARIDQWWTPNPLLALGRFVGNARGARLGELLLDAPDLRTVRQSQDGRFVEIEGTIDAGSVVYLATVEIDRDQGYIARSWRTRDALSGVPVEAVAVLAVERIDGCYLPCRAVRRTYAIDESIDPDKVAHMEEEVRAAGIDPAARNPRDPATRAAYSRAVAKAFGDTGIPYRDVWHVVRLTNVRVMRVNQSIPPDRFELPFPEGSTWADFVLFRDSKGQPLEDPDAGMGLDP